MNKHLMSFILCLFCIVCTRAQDVPIQRQKYILFPHPLDRKWTTSIGLIATTMPYEITQYLHYRIPAGDFHVLRSINSSFYLDGRVNFQVLQNLISIGPRWAHSFSDRFSFSLGDDVGYWFGIINLQGFKTKGSGWQNYPNISFGYRFNKQILLSLKTEAIITYGIKTFAGENQVATNYKEFSGTSYTVALEQPFYKKKYITLGFRAIYSNFFWQTWTAFTNFNRNFFYPQLIVGLIL